MPEEEHVDFKILDVGCSARPKGDVNIGFLRGGLNPQTGERIQGEFMSPQKAQKTKNFLLAEPHIFHLRMNLLMLHFLVTQ
jgi:hypothetical protein